MIPLRPLTGLRVVDLSTWIAGAYSTKQLADAGAQVTKVEGPGGDPLRRWSASGAEIPAGRSGALFNHLGQGKQSVLVDPDDPARLRKLGDLLAAADVVVWSRGSEVAEHPSLHPHAIRRTWPHLTVTAITPFGLEGPWADKPATEFTLQAWSGGIVGLARGRLERAPIHVGGQVGEWIAGAFATFGTLASVRRGGSDGELVDVSMLESSVHGLTYFPVTFHDQLGRPMRRKRSVPTPGVQQAKDGLVGLGVGTGQQWLDFCAMVGRPEWTEDPKLFLDRSRLTADIDAWAAEQTVEEILELTGAMRIPNAPIANGENAPTFEHLVQRGTFRVNATDGALGPVPPWRFSSAKLRPAEPAPRLGQHSLAQLTDGRGEERADRPERPLPFSGLRILDMTAYWAGPLVGHLLALLGAEVIHLESPKRPDGARMVGGVPQTDDAWWERGPIFAALNSNKKSLAVDLEDPRGRALVHRLVETCDAVVENFTPRVLAQLDLEWETLKALKSDLVMLRMPGFGLDGPWRELAAFAFVIEDASGLTWMTGYPDELPQEPYSVGDPNAGLHALIGLLLALEHRDETGEGSLVEAAMVDAALNITAEQVVETSAYGALLGRDGNRGPCACPQDLFHAAGPDDDGRDDSWVAIAVADDVQWEGLVRALGKPAWATDPTLATLPGRVAARDEIGTLLGEWCRQRSADEIVTALWDEGVAVGKVVQPHRQGELAQLQARGFFETLEHPVAGPSRYSSVPMRMSRGPEQLHATPAPLLGQHDEEILTGLGVSPAELAELRADGVLGHTLKARGKG